MSNPIPSRPSRCGLLFVLMLVLAAEAQGQQSRADDIAQQQAEKRARLAPNTPNRTERALDWFEDHFTDPDTVYMTFGGIYPSAGFAPGIAYRRPVGPARFNIGAAYSLKSYKLAQATLLFPELAGERLELNLYSRWIDATQVPFYGLGNKATKDSRVAYGLRAWDVGAEAELRPVAWYVIGGSAGWRQVEDRAGGGNRPSIETRFSSATAPAIFHESRYLHATALTAIDWRESPGYTRRGGLYALEVSEFRDADDLVGFRRIEADIRQYIPVLKEHWVFAFRAFAQTTNVEDGQVVPYHLLPALGGARSHRGFSDFRFQDRHLLLVSGEYRWLPSRVLDMALFVDAGKVASARRNLDFRDLKTAVGVGARFHGPTVTPLRIDVAKGDEGVRVHITGGLTF